MRLSKRKPPETTFGADPELVIHNKRGQLVHATDYFKDDSTRGAIAGTDGDSTLVELRPRPYKDVIKLVAELQNIFKVIDANLRETKAEIALKAGHYVSRKAIGGHIHIGIGRELPRGFKRQWYIRHLVMTLDKILIDVVEPRLDDSEQAFERRSHSHYGKRDFGESHYKQPTYGIEYRPTGSWLHSPEVALVYLGFAKMVYQAVVLDLPIYRSPEKTLVSFLRRSKCFSEDVKLAIKIFADLTVNRNSRLNWNVNILDNWIKRGDKKNA
jgi:hypothetical protein